MKLFSLFLFFSLFTVAEDYTQFGVEKTPGKGQFTYTLKGVPQTLELGNKTGNFGVGFVFKSSQLSKDFQKRLKGKTIIQIDFGNYNLNNKKQAPQFASLALIGDSVPQKETQYSLQKTIPEKILSLGLLMFQPPFTTEVPSAEKKLQGSYFTKLGTAKYTPLTQPSITPIVANQKNYNVQSQMVKVVVEALLMNPFDAQNSPSLRGTVEIPVFSAVGPEAEKLFTELASNPKSLTK